MLLESKSLTPQQLFPYTSSYPLKNSDCHKISFCNDGVLKLGHFDIFHDTMENGSRDGLAAKGLFAFEKTPRISLAALAEWSIKPLPNDRNIPTQHIATLLGPTCCVRLVTVLR